MLKYYTMVNTVEGVFNLFEAKTGKDDCYTFDIDSNGIYCQFNFQLEIADGVGFMAILVSLDWTLTMLYTRMSHTVIRQKVTNLE